MRRTRFAYRNQSLSLRHTTRIAHRLFETDQVSRWQVSITSQDQTLLRCKKELLTCPPSFSRGEQIIFCPTMSNTTHYLDHYGISDFTTGSIAHYLDVSQIIFSIPAHYLDRCGPFRSATLGRARYIDVFKSIRRLKNDRFYAFQVVSTLVDSPRNDVPFFTRQARFRSFISRYSLIYS